MSTIPFSLMTYMGLDSSKFESGIDSSASQVEQSFEKMMRAGRRYLGASGVLLYLRQASKVSREFGQTMADLSAITERSVVKMGRSLRQMEHHFGAPLKTGLTLYETVSSGIRGTEEELVDFVKSSAKAARVIRSDTYTVANAMTTMLHAYQIATKDAGQLVDSMYTMVKEGKIHGNEFARTAGLVINSASEAGVTINELFASLAHLSRTMTPSSAMISLNQMMNSFMGPTERATRAAKELGLELSVDAIKAKGFATVMRDVHEKVGGNVEAIKELFGNIRAARGALAITGKQFNEFLNILDEMEYSVGKGEVAFRKQIKTAQVAAEEMQVAWSKAMITIGSDLNVFHGVFYKTITALIDGFNDASHAFTQLLDSFGFGEDGKFRTAVEKFETFIASFPRHFVYLGVAVKVLQSMSQGFKALMFHTLETGEAQKFYNAQLAKQIALEKQTEGSRWFISSAGLKRAKGTAFEKLKSFRQARGEAGTQARHEVGGTGAGLEAAQLDAEITGLNKSFKTASAQLQKLHTKSVTLNEHIFNATQAIDDASAAMTQFINQSRALNKSFAVLNRHATTAQERLDMTAERARESAALVLSLRSALLRFRRTIESILERIVASGEHLTEIKAITTKVVATLRKILTSLGTFSETMTVGLGSIGASLKTVGASLTRSTAAAKLVNVEVLRLEARLAELHGALAGAPSSVTKTSTLIRGAAEPIIRVKDTPPLPGDDLFTYKSKKHVVPKSPSSVKTDPTSGEIAIPAHLSRMLTRGYATPPDRRSVPHVRGFKSMFEDPVGMSIYKSHSIPLDPKDIGRVLDDGVLIPEVFTDFGTPPRLPHELAGVSPALLQDIYRRTGGASQWPPSGTPDAGLREMVNRIMASNRLLPPGPPPFDLHRPDFWSRGAEPWGNIKRISQGGRFPVDLHTPDFLTMPRPLEGDAGIRIMHLTEEMAPMYADHADRIQETSEALARYRKAVKISSDDFGRLAKRTGDLEKASQKAAQEIARGSITFRDGMSRVVGAITKLFGAVMAAQIGWSVGKAIAEKFEFAESDFFKALADAMLGGEIGDTVKRETALDAHNIEMQAKGIERRIKDMEARAVIDALEAERIRKKLNKALSKDDESALVDLGGIYERIRKLEESREGAVRKYTAALMDLTNKVQDAQKELDRIVKEVGARSKGVYTTKEKTDAQTGVTALRKELREGSIEDLYAMSNVEEMREIQGPAPGPIGKIFAMAAEKLERSAAERHLEPLRKKLGEDEVSTADIKAEVDKIRDKFTDSFIQRLEAILALPKDRDTAKQDAEKLKAAQENVRRSQINLITGRAIENTRVLEDTFASTLIDNVMDEVQLARQHGIQSSNVGLLKSQMKDAEYEASLVVFDRAVEMLQEMENDPAYAKMDPSAQRAMTFALRQQIASFQKKLVDNMENSVNAAIKAASAVAREATDRMNAKLKHIADMALEDLSGAELVTRADAYRERSTSLETDIKGIRGERGLSDAERAEKLHKRTQEAYAALIEETEREIAANQFEKGGKKEDIDVERGKVLRTSLENTKKAAEGFTKEAAQEAVRDRSTLDTMLKELNRLQVTFREESFKALQDWVEYQMAEEKARQRELQIQKDAGEITPETFHRETRESIDRSIKLLDRFSGNLKQGSARMRETNLQRLEEIARLRELNEARKEEGISLRDSAMSTIQGLVKDGRLDATGLKHSMTIMGLMGGAGMMQQMASPTVEYRTSQSLAAAQKAQRAVAASMDSFVMSQKYNQASVGRTVTKIYEFISKNNAIVLR